MFTKKEKELLSTFSSVEEFASFSNNVNDTIMSFAEEEMAPIPLGAGIQNVVNRSKEGLVNAYNNIIERKNKGEFDPGTPIGNTLIGAGIGAGLGGIYGAFKNRKEKKKAKKILQAALLGAGLGAGLGFVGTKAKQSYDQHRIDTLKKEIAAMEGDWTADPVVYREKHKSLSKLIGSEILPDYSKLSVSGPFEESVASDFTPARAALNAGNEKLAAANFRRMQIANRGKNHPLFGQPDKTTGGVDFTDEEALRQLKLAIPSIEEQAKRDEAKALNEKVLIKAGNLKREKAIHDKDRNFIEKLFGINEFKPVKHWGDNDQDIESLLKIARGDDQVLAGWAIDELARRQANLD